MAVLRVCSIFYAIIMVEVHQYIVLLTTWQNSTGTEIKI